MSNRLKALAAGSVAASTTVTIYTAPAGYHTRVWSLKGAGGSNAQPVTISAVHAAVAHPIASQTSSTPTESLAVAVALNSGDSIQVAVGLIGPFTYHLSGTEYPN